MKPIQGTNEKRAFRLVLKLAKALREFQDESTFCENITYTQFAILDYVVEAGGKMRLAELHPLLNVEKSTTTRLVAPLLGMELLTKQRMQEDARAYELLATEEGLRVHAAVWECITGHLGKMLEHLPDAEFAPLLHSLEQLTHALDRCCKE